MCLGFLITSPLAFLLSSEAANASGVVIRSYASVETNTVGAFVQISHFVRDDKSGVYYGNVLISVK